MAKRRLDALLVDRGLAPDRAKAQALVMAGAVSVDERPAPKAGTLVEDDASLSLAGRPKYMGRGGEKLKHALDAFGLDVSGLVAADVGSSTGGFTDCLLQRGAQRVYAIDSGKGQLDFRLRGNPRVISMEQTNARTLESLPEPVDLMTIDVSFISLQAILPVARRLFKEAGRAGAPTDVSENGSLSISGVGTDEQSGGCAATTPARGSIIALFKPQFEARKDEVPRGGVIRDPQLHPQLIGRFARWCVTNGFRVLGMTSSPIAGADGNREFFFWLRQAESLPRDARRAKSLNRNAKKGGWQAKSLNSNGSSQPGKRARR